jgi:hypothetical protein
MPTQVGSKGYGRFLYGPFAYGVIKTALRSFQFFNSWKTAIIFSTTFSAA